MTSKFTPEILHHADGSVTWFDRRVPEIQIDGTVVMRDPVTGVAYDPRTGAVVYPEKGPLA